MPRSSEQEAYETEKELIRNWGRLDVGTGCLRNLTDGGEGNITRGFLGWHHTEESNRKNSEAHKGLPGPMVGKTHSIESRLKMSQSMKGRLAPNKGKPHSLDARLKMSESQKKRFLTRPGVGKGVKRSPEAIENMRVARWGNV